jgi:hypothetical protein
VVDNMNESLILSLGSAFAWMILGWDRRAFGYF